MMLLPDYTEGVYATSACSLGHKLPQMILNDDMAKAEEYCNWFFRYLLMEEIFPLELQFHPNYKDQYKINDGLVKLSDDTKIPLTVSSDAHFIDESDMDTRKAIQAIAWHKKFSEVNDSLKIKLFREFSI